MNGTRHCSVSFRVWHFLCKRYVSVYVCMTNMLVSRRFRIKFMDNNNKSHYRWAQHEYRKKNIYKLSHKWYISVCSIILFILLCVLSACCCWFFYISLLVRRCMESSMSESMFHTDSIFRDSYCIFMDCLLHLLYGVCVCVFVATSVVISWLFCVVVRVCLFNIGRVRLHRDVISRHSSTIAKMKIEL